MYDGRSALVKNLWKKNHLQNREYDAWCFGGDADLLAALVVEGKKTATSSAYPLYALDNEPLPQEGTYSVILNSRKRGGLCHPHHQSEHCAV